MMTIMMMDDDDDDDDDNDDDDDDDDNDDDDDDNDDDNDDNKDFVHLFLGNVLVIQIFDCLSNNCGLKHISYCIRVCI